MWLHIPTTSASTQARPVWTSGSDWPFRALGQSVTWRETRKPPRFWFGKWKRDGLIRRLCGQIQEPSTAGRGVASWISSLADSRASRGVSPDSSRAPTTTAGSGRTLNESFATFDLAASFWRTSQASFVVESNTFSEVWPRSGSMRNGAASVRPMLARHIDENESSYWPTVTGDLSPREKRYAQGGLPLAAAAGMWPTARTSDTNGAGEHGDGGPDLRTKARNWATPDTNRSSYSNGHKGFINLREQVLSHQVQKVIGHTSTHDTGQRLNPKFVEWLMGWPMGWLDLLS